MRHISILSGLFVVFLFPAYPSIAADPTDTNFSAIRINELFPNPTNEKDEWIELHNFGSLPIDLDAGWALRDKTTTYDFSRESDTIIPPGGYKVIRQATSKIELNNTNETVSLIKEDALVDSISYGTTKEEKSYGYNGSAFEWSDYLTPETANRFGNNQENDQSVSGPDPTVSDADIRINELFPNPKESGEGSEFIELYNRGDADADLSGFILRDASKTGKYVLPQGSVIASGDYLVVSRAESGLSLNNTDETVSLSDPAGNPIDSAAYETTKEEASYSHDGSSFRWSRYLTPDKENRFGETPETGKTDIPKKAYRDVVTEFSASGGNDRNYFWDFGDGSTSRKQEATHTYEETGEYAGTLTISEGVEETVRSFVVDVEKYPKRKVSIAAISPNPSGDDAEAEWISIRNKDKKKIDLAGWSIATGSGKKKLSNHPIRESFVIRSGEERALGREFSAFSLPNGKGYVELRQPDGKVLTKASYDKAGGVKENEVWRRQDGGSWTWTEEPLPSREDMSAASEEIDAPSEDAAGGSRNPETVPETQEMPQTITLEDLSPEDRSRLEAEAEERARRQIFAELLDSGNRSETEGAVLGASDEHGTGYSGTMFRRINQALSGFLSER